MDEQEIFNQIRELQKQRSSIKEQDNSLIVQIMELRDKLRYKKLKKGYYTDNCCSFCRVYGIKEDCVLIYELNTTELYITKETYSLRAFREAYCKECTKEEYDNALDEIVKYFKD